MSEEIHTGGGTFVGENVNTDGGNFISRDKNDNANNLNVYIQPTPVPAELERREISVTVEESLRVEMRELRQHISQLMDRFGTLDKATSVENNLINIQLKGIGVELDAAKSRLNAMELLVKKMEQPTPIFDERVLRSIFYSLIAIVGLLVVIAWLLSGQGVLK